MDPLVTSSLISAGGGLLGSVFGGKKKRGPDLDDIQAFNQQNFENLFKSKMNMADKFGLHRLTMLGVDPGSGSVQPVFSGDGGGGPSAGDFIDQAGQGISRAVAAYAGREERDVMLQSMALDLENKRLQNQRLASEIRLMQSPGTPPPLPVDPLGGKTVPRWTYLAEPDGMVTRVLNQDAGDNEFMMGQDFLMHSLPDMAKNYTRRSMDNFQRFLGRAISRATRYLERR